MTTSPLQEDRRVADAIVAVLAEAGVEFVLGMPGGYTGPIFSGLHGHRTIRTIQVREESIGATMAEAYGRLTEEMRAAGVFRAGEGLQPVTTATTVRVPNGERIVTDGPFAETKEQLAGFYVLECPDLDAAIEWAAKIPGAQSGCVEVRPVIQYD